MEGQPRSNATIMGHMNHHDAIAKLLKQHSQSNEMVETERRLKVRQREGTTISWVSEWMLANEPRRSMDRNEI